MVANQKRRLRNVERGTARKVRLNPRHVGVIDRYFKNGFDKKEALLFNGYSDLTAKAMANSVFEHPAVIAEIERRQERLRKRFDLTEEWVVRRLMMLADANVAEILVKLKKNNYDLNCLELEEGFAISEFVEETYQEGRGASAEEIKRQKLKFIDKKGALDSLARKLGLFKDNLSVAGEVSVVERLQAGRARIGKEEAK